jgi:glycosyltransferase involved in cell wall biosynthesis
MVGYFTYATDSRVQSYVRYLRNARYEVDVVCLGRAGIPSTGVEELGVTVYPLMDRVGKEKSRSLYLWHMARFFFLATWKVACLHLLKRRYRFLHVHNMPDVLVFTAVVPKMFGAGVILDIHDIFPELYSRKFNAGMDSLVVRGLCRLERISCRFADYVIVANDVWRDRIAQRSARRGRCVSIANFPDTTVFSNPNHEVSGSINAMFVILYHGTFSEYHGLDTALQAMGILRNRIGPFRFVLYGEGPYEPEMRAIIERLGLRDCVQIHEPVPLREIPSILKSADIGVVPKKDGLFVGDAMSTKLFQYAVMGVPAVVSRTRAEQRYFGERDVRYFVPEDPEDLAKGIQELYENREYRFRLALSAMDRMKEYSMEATQEKYLKILPGIC